MEVSDATCQYCFYCWTDLCSTYNITLKSMSSCCLCCSFTDSRDFWSSLNWDQDPIMTEMFCTALAFNSKILELWHSQASVLYSFVHTDTERLHLNLFWLIYSFTARIFENKTKKPQYELIGNLVLMPLFPICDVVTVLLVCYFNDGICACFFLGVHTINPT